MTPIATKGLHPNLVKFLILITFCEGTDQQKTPYNELFGFDNFTDYSTHPKQKVNKSGYISTAAGRYQILYRTFKAMLVKFPKATFSPEWQDRFALELIKEANGYALAKSGKFEEAILEVNNIWASLPGSKYGQPTKTMKQCLNFLNTIKL